MPYTIAEAKNKLSRIVHEAERGDPVELTRRGHLVAVIVSAGEYRRWTAGGTAFWEACEALRERYGVAELGIDPGIFEVRDRAPGRDFSW